MQEICKSIKARSLETYRRREENHDGFWISRHSGNSEQIGANKCLSFVVCQLSLFISLV